MEYSFLSDTKSFKEHLSDLPIHWDGKTSVLKLKEVDFNWKQMEWWGFYFEWEVKERLKNVCSIPGEKINRVEFDLKTQVNWDIKAKAIKSDAHDVILNDTLAMEKSIEKYRFHGEIIGLCDVEYNDEDRSFQRWHSELKGGLSEYEKKRRKERPNSTSRYRKTSAELVEILYILFDESSLEKLSIMKQGRNSNNQPRPPKYMLHLDRIDDFLYKKQPFYGT